jgi:sodium/potassium-transporting ATPase subunit alpha
MGSNFNFPGSRNAVQSCIVYVIAAILITLVDSIECLQVMISCLSDVFAGIALMHEQPEGDIMQQSPRDVKKTRLVDFRLIAYAYLFVGNIQSLGSFILWFSYMKQRGPTGLVPNPLPVDDGSYSAPFPLGYLPSQLTFAFNFGVGSGNLATDELAAGTTASSVFYVTLIVSQLAHLLSIRRSETPYFSDLRGFNSWSEFFAALPAHFIPPAAILWAWAGAIATALILTEVPAIQQLVGTDHVPGTYWGYAFAWAALVFVLLEARKWFVYLFPDLDIVRWGKRELDFDLRSMRCIDVDTHDKRRKLQPAPAKQVNEIELENVDAHAAGEASHHDGAAAVNTP